MSGVTEKRGPGRPKKQVDPAVIEHAHAVVAADPRGAPEVVKEPVKAEPPCALDGAGYPAKVVVSIDRESVKVARLILPHDEMDLPRTDLAYTLPAGAKIRCKMPNVYEATELNPEVVRAPLMASTAREAMLAYRTYFQKD